jgi:hypothetical protein
MIAKIPASVTSLPEGTPQPPLPAGAVQVQPLLSTERI